MGVCVCVCVCVRACARACVIVKYFAFVLEQFLASRLIELLKFYCKIYGAFHINDEPEGKCLHTETMKLYCIVHNATF